MPAPPATVNAPFRVEVEVEVEIEVEVEVEVARVAC